MATTAMEYIDRMTVRILPMSESTRMSPYPIVVAVSKVNHRASDRSLMSGSNIHMTRENTA